MTRTPKELTETPEGARVASPLDLIADVLSTVHLASAIFLRAEYTAPWAYDSPQTTELTQFLQPQARRLILFHIIAEGSCWVRISTGEQVFVEAGDIVVLPYGHQHTMGSLDKARPIALTSILPTPPWEQFPIIRHGGGGALTGVVCGFLHCDDLLFDPALEALPPLFSVRPPAGPAAAWVVASIQYALEASNGSPLLSEGVAMRLPEMVFSEALRLYMASNPSLSAGWLAALRDPIVGSALQELHAEPARKWTVEELARQVASSRSMLNDRFVRLLGRPPMQYLAEWRIQLAASLLRSSTFNVAAIAYQVGYESEEAFNRAFKRTLGSPPGQWRQRHAEGATHSTP